MNRCEESTSSPGVSRSIGEGIIEEEEDEEAEEESNKKRMKEDEQEVISLLFCCSVVVFVRRLGSIYKGAFVPFRSKRKASSPGEWSCQRQKSTGRAGSEACLHSSSPAPHQNSFFLQVRAVFVPQSEKRLLFVTP